MTQIKEVGQQNEMLMYINAKQKEKHFINNRLAAAGVWLKQWIDLPISDKTVKAKNMYEMECEELAKLGINYSA